MNLFQNRNTRAAVAVALLFLAALAPHTRAEDATDVVVKAKMLINFTQPQYANWPATAFPDASSPFLIGVVGDDAVAGKLEALVSKQTVDGRRITVRRGDTKGCHLVFIGKAESGRAGSVIGAANVLTVGDADNFTQQGGVIGFFLKGEKIRFHINAKAASRAGVDLTGRLLGAGE